MAAMDEEYEEEGWINRNNQPGEEEVCCDSSLKIAVPADACLPSIVNIAVSVLVLYKFPYLFRLMHTKNRWKIPRKCLANAWGNLPLPITLWNREFSPN